jgi:Protein of unknown function (DUF2911)
MKKLFAPLSLPIGKIGIVAMMALATVSNAQIEMPQPSPGASLTQKVGMSEVKIEYSRPSMKGRKIMGEIVPFGEIWRTGANSPTKFTTTDSITVGGKGLAKGSYVVLTRPGKDSWEIIFNKNPAASAFNYTPEIQKDDVAKVMAKPVTLPMSIENFTFSIGNVTMNSANIEMMWENTYVSVPFTNDVDGKVMAQIKQKLDGPTQSEYFAMSQYYFDNGKGNAEALDFANKAIAKGDRFWMLRHKSLVQAKMGDKAGAIATAKRSLELAKTEKNMDYVRMNEKSIAEWTKM